ncbi:inorganic pyrophosphatase [Labrys miyagiensis]
MPSLKSLLAATLFVLPLAPALANSGNVLAFKQPDKAPDELNIVVEIPAGSMVKYETDTDTGHIIVDRFIAMPMAYPANYGSITRTKAADGDPLDVLVYTRAPIAPGAVMRVRPIGVLKMIDGGDVDDKIVAVPVAKLDPTYDNVKAITDLPKIEQERLSAFFRVYKQIPAGSKVVEVTGFDSADAARERVKAALDAYGK